MQERSGNARSDHGRFSLSELRFEGTRHFAGRRECLSWGRKKMMPQCGQGHLFRAKIWHVRNAGAEKGREETALKT